MTKTKPFTTLRDGTIIATIWQNHTESGRPYFSVRFTRRYQDAQGVWHDTDRFTGTELLRLGELARQVYSIIREARASSQPAA